MNDDLFNYLVATDELDDFLGYELPNEVKTRIDKVVIDYKNELINDNEIQDILMAIELEYKINYELLYKYFKEQLN